MSFLGGIIGGTIAKFLLGLAKLWAVFKLGESRAFAKVEREARDAQDRMRNVKEPTSDEVTDALDRGEF